MPEKIFEPNIEILHEDNPGATRILVDVPIGPREKDSTPRQCDTVARKKLGSPCSSSVFPTPIREFVLALAWTSWMLPSSMLRSMNLTKSPCVNVVALWID